MMKTLYYLFLIKSISKSLQRRNSANGDMLLNALYKLLPDVIFGGKK